MQRCAGAATPPACTAAPRARRAAARRAAPPRVVAAAAPAVRPCFELSAEAAFEAQWEALASNDVPHCDHGVEVLYAFADVDLYAPRSKYFGYSSDLGQFERFRRVLHTRPYRVLLGHVARRVQSTLRVSEREVRQRVFVDGFRTGEAASYCLTLVQQLGGRRDGWWLAAALSCDDAAPGDE